LKDKTGRGAAYFLLFAQYLAAMTDEFQVISQVNTGGADKSLARPVRKQATATEDFEFIYPIYNHNWRNVSSIYIYKTRLASKEIFST
jgi:hypothetical protein